MMWLFASALVSVALLMFAYWATSSPFVLLFAGFTCGWSVALAYAAIRMEAAL